jgi:hypothetical protein
VQFTNAGGDANADRIAKWNGSSWSALGSGISNGQVNSLAFNGSILYVGGSFTDAGGNVNADYIAQWDGSSWSALGDGVNNAVNAIGVSGLDIYIAGNFTNAGIDINADYIAKLDGGTWAALGSTPLTGAVNTIVVAGASVYAGGDFIDVGGNTNIDRIAVWDGTSWSPFGSGLGATVVSIALSGGDVYAGGLFNDAGGNPNADKIAKWDGTSWSALGSGLSNFVNTIAVSGSNIYVTGNFVNAGGDANADYIAKWDGTAWSALGSTPLNAAAAGMKISGLDLYVGGNFTDASGNANADRIALFPLDETVPTVNSFTANSFSTSLTIPITAFTTSDNIGVTGYKITESSVPPSASASGWTASAPTTYTVASSGSYVIYPWSKDAMGNVSAIYGSPVSVSVDVIKPTVNSFSATSPSNSFNIPITAFTASDNFEVTGYKITTSSTPPSAGAAGWSASVPTIFTVASNGNYTLYPWAKDAVGNVSAVYGLPASVTVDKNAPTVTYFSVPASSTNLTISITAFTASDNLGVAGYKITEDSTSPAASDSGWVASAPTLYTVMSDGDYTLYPWAKDAAGNISAVYGSPINVYVDTSTPTVTSFSVPASSKSLTVTITAFTATDNVSVTSYKITESAAPPAASDSGWTASVPTIYTVANDGSYTLYPWAKDAAGNISPVSGSPASVTVDTTAPTVISFSVPSISKSLAIPITELTATDNMAVTGYKITTSATPPAPGAAGWTGSAPTTYTVSSSGNYTLYPWAKDAVGNVSPVDEAPYSVTVDTLKPTVNSFTASSPSASLNISITAFTALDNVAVTSYLITESATQPASNDSSWSASAPTTYTVASDGNYTLYPWAKDAAGNVSSVFGSPSSVEVNTSLPADTAAPSVGTFTTASISNSLDIPITSFTALDDIFVAGYLITESNAQPSSNDSGWSGSAPTTYTVASDGNYILYPWTKDAAGNVSSIYGSPASVEVNTASSSDTTPPYVDSFTTSSWEGYSMSIATFAASDNMAITGYLITESSTPPSPNDAGWAASAPAYYTFASEGTYTLYPWVKDADGNVSALYSSPATVVLSFLPPTILDIQRYYQTPNEVTSSDTLVFAVHFYGIVLNVDPSDFVVTGGTTATVTNVSSGADSRLVTISGGDLASFNGTVGLDISLSQDIVSTYTGKHLVASVPNPNEIYTVVNSYHTITGNAGVGGATLSYMDEVLKTVTADGSGNYSITVPSGWSGAVTPSKVGYSFSPINRVYSNVVADQTAQNYIVTAITYIISGNVGKAGVTLSYTDGIPKTVMSDGSGNYFLPVSYGWSGTVTPFRIGYSFTPPNKTYVNVTSNKTAQNYLATLVSYAKDTTGVFRPSNGLLYLKNKNTTGFADISINYGLGGDYPVVGDWDGNGTVTIGVYRNASFYLRNSNTLGFADMVFAFGQLGDQPVAGDWNGDGIDTIGLYRPSTGQFLLRDSNSAGAADYSFYLGNVGDVGIAGDWTAKGFDTVGVFRPSNGIIFLKNKNQTGYADIALNYGLAGDQPVVGDWDGNGTDTIGVYRNAQFLLRNSNTIGFAEIVFGLGIGGDMPIAGDWDGKP